MSTPVNPATTIRPSDANEMYVLKRSGTREIVSFDKILRRIKTIGQEVGVKINYTNLVIKVIDQLYDNISTTKLDELSAEQCAVMASIHTDYNILAGRITISNHHKNTTDKFSDVVKTLYENVDNVDRFIPLISKELYDIVCGNAEFLNGVCDYSRDYLIDYFGFKTLEKSYLIRKNKKVVERPQHMWLRVALGIHGTDFDRAIETYNLMSNKYFTHATPTLFNAGTAHPQLSSCYLLAMEEDSIDGIYNTLKDCATISKWAGGIGLHIHNVRATGSHINGTNGYSNGIVPMLRVFNNTARYVDQCVVPETFIYTTDGPKRIWTCSTGKTEVITKHGEAEVVKNVLEYGFTGEMYRIFTEHSIEPLTITGKHPVYVLKNYAEDLKHVSFKPEFDWVDAENICYTDMIVHPIPKHAVDISSITADDCYMYGIMLYCGNSGCFFVNKGSQEHIKNFLVEYFENNVFKYDIEDKYDEDSGEYWEICWRINQMIHTPFRHADFLNEYGDAHINSRWLNLPPNKTNYILKGYCDFSGKGMSVISSSAYVNESMKYLCLKMGVLPTGYCENINGTNTYVLNIPKTPETAKLFDVEYNINEDDSLAYYKHDGFLASRVTKIDVMDYTGDVYDLQLETEHNYLLTNGLVHNGGGKRNGSFAIYLEPWHSDIELFLQMRKNHGDEELKARDLFYSLWMPDLFMERVKSGGVWTLMCPHECPGLSDVYGDEFKRLYESYETSNKGRKTMNARDLWFQILDAQMETGTPYIVYKDAANKKSNQKNVGTIKSSNLCTEILEYSDSNETAVCNLASIALPAFVEKNGDTITFNYKKLHDITKVVTYNLNRVIDVNFYPTEKTERSNKRHRPIGLGVQGLADVFMMMGFPFSSKEAVKANKDIFETIYHAALEESCEIAKRDGSYSTFDGSPASQGILQFDMWGVDPGTERYDWLGLKEEIKSNGLRNSLLLAPMPTASTSQILGYNECIEPITSNIYSRCTIAGEFIMANKYLMTDLIKLDLWNEKLKNNIIANGGSVQHITEIPAEIREKYKTVWEMGMVSLIDMAADRGAFICQSQSLNLWVENPNYNNLTSMHFYGWSKGLKTGIYYLRRKGRHQAQQFTIEPEKKTVVSEDKQEPCEMCSS